MRIHLKYFTMLTMFLLCKWAGALDPSAKTHMLEQAADYALAKHPEMNIMQARIEQADAQLGGASASFYPPTKTSLTYQHSDHPAQAFAKIIAQRRLDFNSSDFNHPGGVDNYRPQVPPVIHCFAAERTTTQIRLRNKALNWENPPPVIAWRIMWPLLITESW